MDLMNSVGKIIVFLMIFFSIFLLTVKSNKTLSNRIFALFLLITAFDLTGFFVFIDSVKYPDILILKIASSLLQMPLFYLYVLSVCYSNFTIKKKHIIHAALFFLFLSIFKITSLSNQSISAYKIVGEVQYITYIIAIFLVLKKYKTVYLENYSNPDYTSYKWLFQITILFCIAHVNVLVRMGLTYLQYETYLLQNINVLISIIALFVICWIVFKALYSPQIFTGVKIELTPIESSIEKHKANKINDINSNKSIHMVISYMETEKPYLDFELTLQKLASQLDIPEKELSVLINHYLGKHFFDFINEYRIGEAKNILENPNNKELTILEVLYQVGFNSKSSFYTAFKKIANQTPTQYRKNALSD